MADENEAAPITMESGMTPPPITRESKYPWDDLADLSPEERATNFFFVQLEDEEEANKRRPSVYASGKNYYEKRGIDLSPVARVFEHPDKGWGVGAWAFPTESPEAQEEAEVEAEEKEE